MFRGLGFSIGTEEGAQKNAKCHVGSHCTCSHGGLKKSQNVIWGNRWAVFFTRKTLKTRRKVVGPKKRQNVIWGKNCTCSKGGPKKRQNVIWGKTALVQKYQGLRSPPFDTSTLHPSSPPAPPRRGGMDPPALISQLFLTRIDRKSRLPQRLKQYATVSTATQNRLSRPHLNAATSTHQFPC